MGVKITDIIPRKQITFEELSHKKIAIDASNMLYQFVSSIRQQDGTPLMDSNNKITSHLQGILSRLTNLMFKNIKLAVVFDGKPPILKINEQENRAHRKRLAEEKLAQAKEEEDYDSMLKYSKQTTKITQEMMNEAKELISYLGIPVIQAPSEAEAQASFLAKNKDVDYVASSDMDCLLYGAPQLLTNLTISQRKRLPSGSTVSTRPDLIELDNVLKTLDITQDQLIVIAILVGTDYNVGGIKNIGQKKALKLVKKNKKFEDIFKELETDLDWKEIYEAFKHMPVLKKYSLNWNQIETDKILKFLVDKHDFQESRVLSSLEKVTKIKDKKQAGLDKFF